MERTQSPDEQRRIHFAGGQPSTHTEVAAPLTVGFVRYALHRWWKVAVPAALVLSIGGGLAVWGYYGALYRASAWVRIEDRRPRLAFEELDSPKFVQTNMELIKSPLVLGPAISSSDVAGLPEIVTSENPQDWVSERVSVRSVGNSELYQIHYDSPNQENAAKIVNAILDSYMKVHAELADSQTQRTLDLLDAEMAFRMKDIERHRDSLKELTRQMTGRDPAFLGDIKEKSVVVATDHPLHELNRRLADTEVERQILEAEVKAHEQLVKENGADAPPTPQALARAVEEYPTVLTIKNRIAANKQRLHQMQSFEGRGKNHPAVVLLTKEISQDESELIKVRTAAAERITHDLAAEKQSERDSTFSKLSTQLANQRALEQLLRDRITQEQEELRALGDRTLELEFARSDLERAGDVFDRIADRATAMRTEMRAPSRVTALRRALPGEVVLQTSPLKKVFGVVALGLAIPLILPVLWERRVKRIADSEQLKGESKLPVLAEISQLPTVEVVAHPARTRRRERVRAAYEESIDLLRNSLTLPEAFKHLQVLSVASATSGEGKTSLATQLALSLARATSKEVLLVDADMRAPDIHMMFDVPLGPGLAQVLQGECTADEAINRSWNSLVHIMPAGILHRNPHIILNAATMENVLGQVRGKYRYVVIDAPPLLAASEAFVISKCVDGVIVCAMRDVSRGPQLRFACERLLSSGANPLGVVLSGVPWADYSYRYGNYAYYDQPRSESMHDEVVAN